MSSTAMGARPDRAILRRVTHAHQIVCCGGYAGQKLETAIAHIDRPTIEISRPSDLTGPSTSFRRAFVILPRCWVVERIIAWLSRCRRVAKDVETPIASFEAWMVVSSIRRMMRRNAKLEL
jgi:transposase